MKIKSIFLSAFAAVAIFGASFAFNHPVPANKDKAVLTAYTVTQETTTQFKVTALVSDPSCSEDGARVCQISTTQTPVNGWVDKDQASIEGRKD